MSAYDWWKSPSHTSWYYHTPRKRFKLTERLETVDETSDSAVNDIVAFLNEMGYETLSSCEGNELVLEDFENAYAHLLVDIETIRTDGLPLINLESGQKKILRDPTYRLPWNSAEEMFISSLGNDLSGFLGVICPTIIDSKPIWELSQISDNISVCLLGHHASSPIIGVSVKSDESSDHRETWSSLVAELKETILP
jgi:hypothetical protein